MTIAVLAIQGAFLEHCQKLDALGISYIEIRQKKDLDKPFDALILPGGESTAQGKLLLELDLLQPLRTKIKQGLPVLGTCAGLILLAEKIESQSSVYLGTLPVTVVRNAYGRQLGSFYTCAAFADRGNVSMTFIRAPYVAKKMSEDVEVLAEVDGRIVGVRYQNQIGIAFHPELTDDLAVYQYFIKSIHACNPEK